MKDEKAPSTGGFGPDYVGWSVPVIATAYVMANSLEEAQFKVTAALRRQQRVMLTKLETLQPTPSGSPDDIENIPVNDVLYTGTDIEVAPAEPTPQPTAHVPPCTFCDHHKRDIQKRGDCTPGQECHADYWRKAIMGRATPSTRVYPKGAK